MNYMYLYPFTGKISNSSVKFCEKMLELLIDLEVRNTCMCTCTCIYCACTCIYDGLDEIVSNACV